MIEFIKEDNSLVSKLKQIVYKWDDFFRLLCALFWSLGPGIMLMLTAIGWHINANWAWVTLFIAGVLYCLGKVFGYPFGF